MRKMPPCKDCTDRKLLCHGSCKKYQEWKKEIDEQNTIRQKEKEKIENSYSVHAVKAMNQKIREGRK